MYIKLRSFLIFLFVLVIQLTNGQSTRKKTVAPSEQPAKTTKPVTTPADTVKKEKTTTSSVAEPPLRKEFQAAKSSERYYIIPSGKSGVNIFFATDEKNKGMQEWNWTVYDNKFEEVAKKSFNIDSKLEFGDYYYDEIGNHIYIFFGKQEKKPGYPVVDGFRGKFEIIDLDVDKQTFSTMNGEFEKKMHLNFIKAINGQVYIGGSNVPTNSKLMQAACVTMLTCFIGGKKRFDVFPYMVRIDRRGAKEIKLPMTKQGEVLNVDFDTTQKKIFCIAIDAPVPTDRNLMICEITTSETAGKAVVIKPSSDNYIINGQVQSISPTEKIVIGSYFKKTGKTKLLFGINRKMNEMLPASTGLYVLKITNNKQDYIQFYPFSKFTDISNAISSISKEKTKSKKDSKSKAKQGKLENLFENVSFNILPHKIITRGEDLIMISDVYHGVYHTESYQTYNGKTWTTSYRTVFDGWSFDLTLVAAFDKKGEMKWNSTFPLSGGLSRMLKEPTKVLQNPDDSRIVMVYAYGDVIKSQVISGDELVEGQSSTKIFTGSEKDKIKSTTDSNITYWYDNYFIAYGYQDIKGKDEKNKKQKRAVFYLNKVAYR